VCIVYSCVVNFHRLENMEVFEYIVDKSNKSTSWNAGR
jgi:hypothetical protein